MFCLFQIYIEMWANANYQTAGGTCMGMTGPPAMTKKALRRIVIGQFSSPQN